MRRRWASWKHAGCRPSGVSRWSSCPLGPSWMRRRCRRGWRNTCPAWGRSNGSGSWTRRPWPPITPTWSVPWCACWCAMTRHSLPWSPRSWRCAGCMKGGTIRSSCPTLLRHRALVEDFVQRFWTYYDQLLAYRERPTPEEAARLAGEFETLFSTVTGYDALDERIAKTRTKKGCLLMVLTHPEIPLHNNPAELGARARVRKRDVSFGPRTREGAMAWDTFMTLVETATKLGVSFSHYIHDRVSGASQMPSLADLIAQRAKILNLGASWDTS